MATPMRPEVVPAHAIYKGIETAGFNVLFNTVDNPNIRQHFLLTEDQAVRWAAWLQDRQEGTA
jgi:hypothetical protein